ncbi:MAG: DUF2849 domain-containing protein [Kiloniellaceae bacterium]
MTAKVVTANRLIDGLVVYLDHDGGWSEWIGQSRVARSQEESAEILALAERPDQGVVVVGPYLIDVEEADGGLRPVRYREVIRSLGPTVRTDLGKQAAQG